MNTYLSMSQSFTTSVDEFDFNEFLKPSAILQYFQDLATAHAEKIGIGFFDMKSQNLFWVLSRVSYRVNRYPKLGEEITVVTYPKAPRRADTVRDYYILDKQGNTLICGSSKWCLLDLNTHSIKRCDKILNFTFEEYNPEPAFENANPKIEELCKLDGILSEEYFYDVKITDLDRNMHMNNARYGDIILNSCTIDELSVNKINSFDINFLSEMSVAEKFTVRKAVFDGNTYFEALKQDNKPIFRAKIGWEKI